MLAAAVSGRRINDTEQGEWQPVSPSTLTDNSARRDLAGTSIMKGALGSAHAVDRFLHYLKQDRSVGPQIRISVFRFSGRNPVPPWLHWGGTPGEWNAHMMFDVSRYAASQPPTADIVDSSKDQRGVVHALPLALGISASLWAVGLMLALGLMHRL